MDNPDDAERDADAGEAQAHDGHGTARDDETGQFVSTKDHGDHGDGAEQDDLDDRAAPRGHRGRDREREDDHAAPRGHRGRGFPSAPSRTLTESEIRGFLTDLLENGALWMGANDGRPADRPPEGDGATADDSGEPEPRPPARSSEDARGKLRLSHDEAADESYSVLTQPDVEALEAEGYVVRQVPPRFDGDRTASESYALVSVDVAETAENGDRPERSVDEILSSTTDRDRNGQSGE